MDPRSPFSTWAFYSNVEYNNILNVAVGKEAAIVGYAERCLEGTLSWAVGLESLVEKKFACQEICYT